MRRRSRVISPPAHPAAAVLEGRMNVMGKAGAGRCPRIWIVAMAGGSLLASLCGAAPAAGAADRSSAPSATGAPGAQVWVSRYNGPGNGGDRALSLAVSPDGKRVFVTGRRRGSSLKADYATIAYDVATGTRLWVSRYNGPGNGVDYATKVVVSPDGTRVYVTGRAYGGTADLRDYATVAYDAATGDQLWARIYEADTCCLGGATAMAVSPDGKRCT